MSHRIYPSQLQEPYDLGQIKQMVESWRGTTKRNVPKDVQVIGWMLEAIETVADYADTKAEKCRAIEEVLDGVRVRMAYAVEQESKRLRDWPEEATTRYCRNQADEACAGVDVVEKTLRDAHEAITNGSCNGHVEPQSKSITGKAAQ